MNGGMLLMASKVLGFYFDDSRIDIVICKKGKACSFENVGMIEVPKGIISEGEIKDVQMAASLVRPVLKEKKIRCRNASITFNSPNVVVRETRLPYLAPNELKAAVVFDLSQTFPGIADTHSIGYSIHKSNNSGMEGMVCFCPSKIIEGYAALAEMLGLYNHTIFPLPACVQKSLEYSNKEGIEGSVLIANMSGSNCQTIVVNKSRIVLNRYASGGNSFSSIEEHIRRTAEYFAYNSDAGPVRSIFLTGFEEMQEETLEYFKNAFTVPVDKLGIEIFQDSKHLHKSYSTRHTLACGSALAFSDPALSTLNLIPSKDKEKNASISRTAIAAVLCIVVFIGCMTGYAIALLKNDSLQNEEMALMQNIAKFSEIKKVKDELSKTTEWVKNAEKISAINEQTSIPAHTLIEMLASCMPESVFAVTLSASQDGTVLINGRAKDSPSIALFLQNIKECSAFNDANISNITAQTSESGMPVDYSFTMSINIARGE